MNKKIIYIGQSTAIITELECYCKTHDLNLQTCQDKIGSIEPIEAELVLIQSNIALNASSAQLEGIKSNSTLLVLLQYEGENELPGDIADYFDDILNQNPNHLSKKIDFYRKSIAALSGKTNHLISNNRKLTHKVKTLSKQLTTADSNLIIQEKVLEKINQISLLSRQINCLDLETIAQVCIKYIPKLISARFASLYSYDSENHILRLLQHNHPYRIAKIINVKKHLDSPMSMALRDKKIQLIKDFQGIDTIRDFSKNYQSNSCMIAPLLSGNKVIGILNLADKIDDYSFDSRIDLPPVQLLCEIVGSAMSNIELYEQLEKKAQTDSMTNLLNHRTFYKVLQRESDRARRYKSNLSLIMIDLDGLKQINDTYGHRAGDAVILHVSHKIRECVRHTDMAARYGGDEFAAILPNTSMEEAYHLAERINSIVAEDLVDFDGQKLKVSVSIGLGQYQHNQSIEDFMSDADNALFDAKAAGKNQIKISKVNLTTT
ncbi:MAG: sensor domain-containing diguanylate cyclase [Phycisphaerae bacterium]|nr:sensor domain-containing diguanylate cyclase [Phycisphaerae bacterium]